MYDWWRAQINPFSIYMKGFFYGVNRADTQRIFFLFKKR